MTSDNDPPEWLSRHNDVGRLTERVDGGLRRFDERMEDHEKHDIERFERLFQFLELSDGRNETRMDKMDTAIALMAADIKELMKAKNQQDGALALGKVVVAGIGAFGGFLGGLIGEFAFKKMVG